MLSTPTRARRALHEARLGRLRVADLVEPWVMAHRGGASIFPEDTLEAVDGAVALGAKVCDGGDIWVGRDGSLLSMHDETVDRTTTSTGDVADHTAMSWANLAIDAGTWFAPAWPNTLRPPTFQQILSRHHPVVLTPQVKDAAGAQAVVDTILAYGVQDSVILEAGDPDAIAVGNAAGIATMWIMTSADVAVDPQVFIDAQPTYVGFDFSAAFTDQMLAEIGDADIELTAWTVDRRCDMAAIQAREVAIGHPIVGFHSNDPFWLDGSAPLLASDTFALATYYHGQLKSASTSGRGAFSSGKLAFTDSGIQWALQGWGSQDAPQASIQASITLDTASGTTTQWAGIAFGCEDDASFHDGGASPHGDGYIAFLRQNGSLQLFRRDGATSASIATTVATAAWTQGQTVQLKVEFIGNMVKATRVDTGDTIQATDTTYRGGYFHFGKNGSLLVSFSACSTT